MGEETMMLEAGKAPRKRKLGTKKGHKKSSKKPKMLPPLQGQKKIKIDQKMKKLFRKRAREYNSDDEDDEPAAPAIVGTEKLPSITNKHGNEEGIESDEPSEETGGDKMQNMNVDHLNDGFSEDEGEEDGDIQPGITKFAEGCRAFRMAFRNIIRKSISDNSLGPILSGHKKLVVNKLAEEQAERKVKGEAKKERQLLAEMGHVKPATYLDSHEKFLISVATKGVVKLFNAVNKAQSAHRGLDPARDKDAKEIRKRTKEAFFSELGKPSLRSNQASLKAQASTGKVETEEPAWAPLRDSYMLTNSRLKDWDKMPDKILSDDFAKISEDSSSDDEE
ncbi:hypothetical protein L6164_031640 [Bauhinia variegata]|uniref:Uncharacterized protein n=1 Tax=Bauhinia variegata TaxID=167791 RepID=A0ACB9LH13_BAUVA|nr:hypothetical protein L6164_031640 [Bauhinia variegata]